MLRQLLLPCDYRVVEYSVSFFYLLKTSCYLRSMHVRSSKLSHGKLDCFLWLRLLPTSVNVERSISGFWPGMYRGETQKSQPLHSRHGAGICATKWTIPWCWLPRQLWPVFAELSPPTPGYSDCIRNPLRYSGDLQYCAFLRISRSYSLVSLPKMPGRGIEPRTPGFSVPCSTY